MNNNRQKIDLIAVPCSFSDVCSKKWSKTWWGKEGQHTFGPYKKVFLHGTLRKGEM